MYIICVVCLSTAAWLTNDGFLLCMLESYVLLSWRVEGEVVVFRFWLEFMDFSLTWFHRFGASLSSDVASVSYCKKQICKYDNLWFS